MYGFTYETRGIALKKIRDTKFYLDNNFVKFGDITYPFSHFFKNSFVNPQRYIAEIQNRAWSIYHYARSKDLVNVFATLTLPSEYHPKKLGTHGKLKGKLINNPKYNPDLTPKKGTKELSRYMRKLTNSKVWRSISKDYRCYFRVTEPHKDGTPHLHISFFIPRDKVEDFIISFEKRFPSPLGEIEANINNPVAYLMKYVLKTFDDLRYGEDKITDLTLWYIYHGICRIYTSRTLISLDIYRLLGGNYTLNELTYMYKDKRLTVYIDPMTKRPIQIFDEFGQIWNKIRPVDVNYNRMRQELKPKLRDKTISYPLFVGSNEYLYRNGNIIDCRDMPFVPAKAKDLQLLEHYLNLDIETDNLHHFGLCQNECISRGLIGGEIHLLNDFNTNIGA